MLVCRNSRGVKHLVRGEYVGAAPELRVPNVVPKMAPWATRESFSRTHGVRSMSVQFAQAAAPTRTSPLLRTFLVTLWSESEGSALRDKSRRMRLQARDHEEAQSFAQRAVSRRWPDFEALVWCVSSEELPRREVQSLA